MSVTALCVEFFLGVAVLGEGESSGEGSIEGKAPLTRGTRARDMSTARATRLSLTVMASSGVWLALPHSSIATARSDMVREGGGLGGWAGHTEEPSVLSASADLVPSLGEGEGRGEGLGEGRGEGEGEGEGDGDGDGEGEALGDGLGEARGRGDGEGSGVSFDGEGSLPSLLPSKMLSMLPQPQMSALLSGEGERLGAGVRRGEGEGEGEGEGSSTVFSRFTSIDVARTVKGTMDRKQVPVTVTESPATIILEQTVTAKDISQAVAKRLALRRWWN